MANLSTHGYGYSAVYQKEKTREEREKSLEGDYESNLISHKKTKEQLIVCIIAVWAFFLIIQAVGFSDAWALGAEFMNIFAFYYRGYAYYEIIELAHYRKAKRELELAIEEGR